VWLARGANEGVNRSAHFIAIAASWQDETNAGATSFSICAFVEPNQP